MTEPEAPHGKLAEVLAAAIRDDIASSGWQVGEVFGTEVALLERYRVSRSVLREAVRLLEYHAVATTGADLAAGWWWQNPRRRPALTPSRSTCSTDSPAARSHHDPRRHRDRQRREGRQTPRAPLRCGLPRAASIADRGGRRRPAQGRSGGVPVPHRVGDAGRQRRLELFLRILVELFRRHWASTDQPIPSHSDLVDVRHAHLRIIEAIGRGDESLARHRTRLHLDAAASWWL